MWTLKVKYIKNFRAYCPATLSLYYDAVMTQAVSALEEVCRCLAFGQLSDLSRNKYLKRDLSFRNQAFDFSIYHTFYDGFPLQFSGRWEISTSLGPPHCDTPEFEYLMWYSCTYCSSPVNLCTFSSHSIIPRSSTLIIPPQIFHDTIRISIGEIVTIGPPSHILSVPCITLPCVWWTATRYALRAASLFLILRLVGNMTRSRYVFFLLYDSSGHTEFLRKNTYIFWRLSEKYDCSPDLSIFLYPFSTTSPCT